MAHDLNRIQYVILNILKKNGAIDHMHSMSCNEICEIEKRSKGTTIYKHIRILEEYGYVKQGARIERANGYILTEQGIAILPKPKEKENTDYEQNSRSN